MTRERLEIIVRWWQARLGLAGWRVSVLWDPAHPRWMLDEDGGGAHASTWRARDYDEAAIAFNLHEFAGWDVRTANAMAVHELLHLRTREVEHVLDLIDGQLHRDSQELAERAHRHAVEGEVERLAWALVELVEELRGGRLP